MAVKLFDSELKVMDVLWDASIVSSSPPDLLDMTYMDIMKYAEKQGLEDLSPYLEKSAVLNKDSFLESVFESYTVKGRLVSIPSQFRLMWRMKL